MGPAKDRRHKPGIRRDDARRSGEVDGQPEGGDPAPVPSEKIFRPVPEVGASELHQEKGYCRGAGCGGKPEAQPPFPSTPAVEPVAGPDRRREGQNQRNQCAVARLPEGPREEEKNNRRRL